MVALCSAVTAALVGARTLRAQLGAAGGAADDASRLFFILQRPGSAGQATATGVLRRPDGCGWSCLVVSVLVDCQALEQLWSRLQSGQSLGRMAQARGIAVLHSWLSHHNRQVLLGLRYLQHLMATGKLAPPPAGAAWPRQPLSLAASPVACPLLGPVMMGYSIIGSRVVN